MSDVTADGAISTALHEADGPRAAAAAPLSHAVIGAVPSGWDGRVQLAAMRALRTLIQGLAGAFPAAGAGVQIVGASYWTSFAFAALAAAIAAAVSFLQNVASFLPDDPNQR